MCIGGRPAIERGISLLATAVLACACGGSAPPPAKPIPPNALRAPAPRLSGRFDLEDPAGPRFRWSGSTIVATFAGSGISVRLRAPSPAGGSAAPADPPLYTAWVDGAPPRTISIFPGDRTYVVAERLDPRAVHVVRLVRESEAFAGVHQLLGFQLPPGGELVTAPPRPRPTVEIVGDSITCGYGVLGRDASCHFSFATERATAAYGALAAAALDVEVATICWSGRGVYRNYDGGEAPTMPELWTPAAAAPAGVVVSLGTNDLLADHDGDGAPDPFDAEAFERAYVSFLSRIREAYPAAPIVVTTSPMLEGELRAVAAESLDRIVARRHSEGDPRIELLDFPAQGTRVGCDSHPNAAMHEILAKRLEEVLARRLR